MCKRPFHRSELSQMDLDSAAIASHVAQYALAVRMGDALAMEDASHVLGGDIEDLLSRHLTADPNWSGPRCTDGVEFTQLKLLSATRIQLTGVQYWLDRHALCRRDPFRADLTMSSDASRLVAYRIRFGDKTSALAQGPGSMGLATASPSSPSWLYDFRSRKLPAKRPLRPIMSHRGRDLYLLTLPGPAAFGKAYESIPIQTLHFIAWSVPLRDQSELEHFSGLLLATMPLLITALGSNTSRLLDEIQALLALGDFSANLSGPTVTKSQENVSVRDAILKLLSDQGANQATAPPPLVVTVIASPAVASDVRSLLSDRKALEAALNGVADTTVGV